MERFKNKGFTLIELVIGMAVLAVAMILMNTMLISQTRNTLDPLHQLRASQLGQGILENVLSRSYDELPLNIRNPKSYGIDAGEVKGDRQNFDDVDDFITDGFESIVTYGDILGNGLPAQYNNYQVKINVVQDSEIVPGEIMKRIDVTIKTPNDDEILFSALKGRK